MLHSVSGDGARRQRKEQRVSHEASVVRSIAAGRLLLAAGTAAFVVAVPECNLRPVFIDGGKAVTEVQVRQKLTSDGQTNVRVMRHGWLVSALTSTDGRTDAFGVDVPTEGFHTDNDDDDQEIEQPNVLIDAYLR